MEVITWVSEPQMQYLTALILHVQIPVGLVYSVNNGYAPLST